MAASKDTDIKSIRNWVTHSPYNSLKNIGISPNASMKVIKNASLEMMSSAASADEKNAVEDLRLIGRRLFADFFLYHISAEEVHLELTAESLKLLSIDSAPNSSDEEISDLVAAMQSEYHPIASEDIEITPLTFD